MSTSDVSLLQIPDIPMKHILEYLEFPSILVLRKVCHDLRNFIDDIKPASRLTKIRVNVYPEFIKLSLESRVQNEICIYYERRIEGCLINGKTILDNEDFVAVFCNDFDIVLRHQKTVLEEFKIDVTSLDSAVKKRVLEHLNGNLKCMNKHLQVKSLYMEVNNHNEILSILPHMDPKPLKLIDINDYLGRFSVVLNFDEIGQLEQWKRAEELSIKGFRLPDLSQNFKHFSKITLQFRYFQIETIILLKEIFLGSSTLCEIIIDYHIRSSDENRHILIEAFGQPFLDTNRFENWFFRIPETNQFLRISLKYNSIFFDRFEQSDVPQNVKISN